MVVHHRAGHGVLRADEVGLRLELVADVRLIGIEQQRHHGHALFGEREGILLDEIIFALLGELPNALSDVLAQSVEFSGEGAQLFLETDEARAVRVALCLLYTSDAADE